jgi:hypothetical protein
VLAVGRQPSWPYDSPFSQNDSKDAVSGADPSERAGKAVANRIRDVLARVNVAHPSLGRHLRNSVRTGTFCSYQPERPTAWNLFVPTSL